MKILIKNVNIITPYEIMYNASLSVECGKISNMYINNDADDRMFDVVIDGKNQYLSPGFIDIHNHGNFGHDAMESTFEALDTMADFHIKNGVTGFLATTMTASTEDTKKAIKNTVEYMKKRKEASKTQVLGLYLEGPYFSTIKKGAQPDEYIKKPCIEEIEDFINISHNNIKIMALAPELEGSGEAIAFLKNNGITVSAGHSNATYEQTMEGIEKGITQVTHLYNGMRAFSHREPGIIGAALTDERVSCEMICDGIHLHKAAMRMATRLKGKDKIILISDAMMAAGLKDGEYILGGQKVFVNNGAAKLKDGTLAGSTLTLNRAVKNMVRLVGVKLEDAVRMASLNPAKAAKVDKTKGSIEIGKDADLILFDDNIDVSLAMVNGKIVFNNLK